MTIIMTKHLIPNYFILLLCFIFICACRTNKTNVNIQSSEKVIMEDSINIIDSIPSFETQGNTVTIHFSGKDKQIVSYTYLPGITSDITVYGDKTIDFNQIIKNCDRENLIATAYNIEINDGKLPISISANKHTYNFTYQYTPVDFDKYIFAYTNSDLIYHFKKKHTSDYTKADIKKWLYLNQICLDDFRINNILDIITNLCFRPNEFEYHDNDVPVRKNLDGICIPVTTNIRSDYYYLVATNNIDEIETFVSEEIANDYVHGLTASDIPLPIYLTNKSSSGNLIIYLIGINTNWDKIIYPIGVITIDNSAPVIINDYKHQQLTPVEKLLVKSGHVNPLSLMARKKLESITRQHKDNTINKHQDDYDKKHKSPEDIGFHIKRTTSLISKTSDEIHVSTDNVRGNYATFKFSHGNVLSPGDAKQIIISYKNTQHKVHIADERYVSYNCWLPLNLGDNYITLTAIDKVGNKSNHAYLITMVENNKSQDINISIDNDIVIFNN